MKIAIVRSFYLPSSVSQYNSQEIGLGIGLVNCGHDVSVFSLFSDVTQPEVYYSNNSNQLTVIPLEGFVFYKFAVFKDLLSSLSAGGYDVIQVNGDQNVMTPLILRDSRLKNKIKIIYQGVYTGHKGLGRLFDKCFDMFIQPVNIQHVDLVFTKTNAASLHMENKGYTNVVTIPVGLNYKGFLKKATAVKVVEEFTPKFSNNLLYVGVVEERRDVFFLIDVLYHLVRKKGKSSFGLVVVGKGPTLLNVKKKVIEDQLEFNVLFVDSIPNKNMQAIYKKFDLFLLPTHYEIYGMVVLEALFYGLFVISTPTAGPLDIISEELLGAIAPLDIDSWCQIILKQAGNVTEDEVTKRLRTEYVKKKYSWNNIALLYLASIERLYKL